MEETKLTVVCCHHKEADNLRIETVNNGWYFHGYLETRLKYDIGDVVYAAEELTKTAIVNEKECRQLDIDGKIPVKVYGIKKPCTGYFWHSPHCGDVQRGLVVYDDDKKANEYAAKLMDEKAYFF